MPQAQPIGGPFVENGRVCHGFKVNEGTAQNPDAVEYVGCVDLTEEFLALPLAQKKAALVAAARADRERSRRIAQPDVSGLAITGSVTL